ncbi:MAG: bifunctional phosphopantothenoylcysteine decarboxylase/phosphopantothenate--cysteine ligase CoaBC [Geobacter sp.]|nr:MAG: bifunctional phosphopantothenoylcysteine decarboxylase/phosphopantothenate--cysteine ligase CoaBC [Geobacter sp.]
MMTGKVIVLGVTGGIAAYKAAELVRLFVKGGADVHVLMTASARQFVTPLTFQTLSRNPVHTDLFNCIEEQEIGHISLADRADLIVIAPATANAIGKIANGIADDLLTTTVMATKAPVLIAPAMNSNMYSNPLYQLNEDRLRKHGYLFADPVRGMLACGWEGEGKLQDPSIIFQEAISALTQKDLRGERFLVTAGPTREELDPVRYLSNHSSGKMGYAIARAAHRRGAEVVLVTGPVCLESPYGVKTLRVESAAQMCEAALREFADSTIIVKAAAVADYRPEIRAESKMKKKGASLSLALIRNPDILAEMGKIKGERILVGFAAETAALLENSIKKLKEKNLDLIVANDVTQEGAGFSVDTNIVKILYRDGSIEDCPLMEKDMLADILLDRIVAFRNQKRGCCGQ